MVQLKSIPSLVQWVSFWKVYDDSAANAVTGRSPLLLSVDAYAQRLFVMTDDCC